MIRSINQDRNLWTKLTPEQLLNASVLQHMVECKCKSGHDIAPRRPLRDSNSGKSQVNRNSQHAAERDSGASPRSG